MQDKLSLGRHHFGSIMLKKEGERAHSRRLREDVWRTTVDRDWYGCTLELRSFLIV
jgi:hypothetical protein